MGDVVCGRTWPDGSAGHWVSVATAACKLPPFPVPGSQRWGLGGAQGQRQGARWQHTIIACPPSFLMGSWLVDMYVYTPITCP